MSAQLLSVETRRALARSPLVGPLTLALTTDPIGERARTRDAVDRAYWTFTRCAKGAPVSVRLVDEKLWAEEAYRRAIVPTMRAAWDLARELTEQRAETSGTVATAHIEGESIVFDLAERRDGRTPHRISWSTRTRDEILAHWRGYTGARS